MQLRSKPSDPTDFVRKGHVMVHVDDKISDYPPQIFTEDPKTWVPDPEEFDGCVEKWGLIAADEGTIESIMRNFMSSNKNISMYNATFKTPLIQFVKALVKRKRASIDSEEVQNVVNDMFIVRIHLTGLEDDCWRRFKVPASTPLHVLHDQIIGPIMGWCRGYHGYVFKDPTDGAAIGPHKNGGLRHIVLFYNSSSTAMLLTDIYVYTFLHLLVR